MIDTLMALWNRGYGGRGILAFIAFTLICISISLLFVTAGGSWMSLFSRKPSSNQSSIISAADLTATAQGSGFQTVADNTVTIPAPTVTLTPGATISPTVSSCTILTVHSSETPLAQVSATAHKGNGGYPGKPTVTPTRPHPTPTPIKVTPTATFTPTPGITPTASSTPIVTPTTSPSPTATVTPTPAPTDTPIPTPTVGVTPTPTPTIGVTPTPTSTVGITPSVTSTVNVTPTATVGTTPTSSPTAGTTATSTIQIGGSPVIGSNSTSMGVSGNTKQGYIGGGGGSGGSSGNSPYSKCSRNGATGDNLYFSNDSKIAASLERNVWLILSSSAVGTILFYAVAYLMMRKRR